MLLWSTSQMVEPLAFVFFRLARLQEDRCYKGIEWITKQHLKQSIVFDKELKANFRSTRMQVDIYLCIYYQNSTRLLVSSQNIGHVWQAFFVTVAAIASHRLLCYISSSCSEYSHRHFQVCAKSNYLGLYKRTVISSIIRSIFIVYFFDVVDVSNLLKKLGQT